MAVIGDVIDKSLDAIMLDGSELPDGVVSGLPDTFPGGVHFGLFLLSKGDIVEKFEAFG